MPLDGRQLAYAREVLGWAQQDLADLSGVELTVISGFEQGSNTFDSEQEIAIVNSFAIEHLYLGFDGSINQVTQLYFMSETKKLEMSFTYPVGQTEIMEEIVLIFGTIDDKGAKISFSQTATKELKQKTIDLLKKRGKDVKNLSRIKIFVHELPDGEHFLILNGRPLSTADQLKAEIYLHNLNHPNDKKLSNSPVDTMFEQLFSEYNAKSPNTDTKSVIGNVSLNKRKCRFCHRTKKDGATFGDEAHALPRALGNKHLVLADECDTCNHYFGDNIEPSLIRLLEVEKSILGIQGRSPGGGRPVLEFSRGTITRSDSLISIKSNAVIKNGDEFTVPLGEGRQIIPSAVYKALVKIALSVIDEEHLPYLTKTVEWARFGKHHQHSLPDISNSIITLPSNPSAQITVYTRKSDTSHLPHIIGEFRLGCFMYVFAVPLSSRDNWDLVGFFDDQGFRDNFGHYFVKAKWNLKNFNSDQEQTLSPTIKFVPMKK